MADRKGRFHVIDLIVNGRSYSLDVDPEKPLLWVLREELGLTAVKYSCGTGLCAACTVFLDGAPSPSCGLAVGAIGGRAITTPEGLVGRVADVLRDRWAEESVSQCGYCQPAQIMHAAALLSANARPTEQQIDTAMTPVLCRCGTYLAIRRAIHSAVEELAR